MLANLMKLLGVSSEAAAQPETYYTCRSNTACPTKGEAFECWAGGCEPVGGCC